MWDESTCFTHYTWAKSLELCRWHHQMNVFEWKAAYFSSYVTEMYSNGSNLQYIIFDLGNDMSPNRQNTSISINDDQDLFRHMGSLGPRCKFESLKSIQTHSKTFQISFCQHNVWWWSALIGYTTKCHYDGFAVQGPLLLIWFNFNPRLDNWLHAQ